MALKVWNGSSWVTSTGVKVWNGSSWTPATGGKVWNGTSWVNFLEVINIDNHTLSKLTFYGPAVVAYKVAADGVVYTSEYEYTPSYIAQETWDTTSSTVGNYEIYVSATGDVGSLSGTRNTWLSLSSDRVWSLASSSGLVSCALTVQIRNASTLVVVDTASINMSADSETFT